MQSETSRLFAVYDVRFVKKLERGHCEILKRITLGLLALSMFLLLLSMNFIGHGIDKFYIAAVATIVLISAYFCFEKRSRHPIIPLQLFRSLKFTAPMLGIIAFGGAAAVALMLPPIYLENLKAVDI